MLARHAARHPRITRTIIGLLLLLLLSGNLWGWHALIKAERTQSIAQLQLEADALARQIEARFEYQMAALHRLASRWSHQRNEPELWRSDVNLLLHDFDNFQAIEWLDSNYQIRWIEPLQGNQQAQGFTYTPEHPNYPLLQKARDTGKATLSNSFTLLQSGRGLAYYVPLQRGDAATDFDGYLLGIFRVEVLIEDLLSDLKQTPINLDIKEQQQTIHRHRTSDVVGDTWQVNSSVHLADNTDFSLSAYPTQQLLASTTTHLPLLVLISGILASLSLCYALWLALLNARRWEALSRSNRALQSEVVRRQATEESLQHNQAQLKLILDMTDHSHDALFIIGLKPQELIYLNRTCWQTTGYSEEQLRNLLAIAPMDIMPDLMAWSESLQELANSQGSAIFQQQIKTRSGKLIPLEISVRHLQRHGRDYLICVGRNNSEQLKVAAQLKRLSHQDGLTGLYNRRHFDMTLDSEWRRLGRQQLPLGLLMLDVDHFKAFNDNLGHLAGDDALRRLAKALNGNLQREGECVCRYGGEEFAIILPGADIEQCLQTAKRLHQAIQRLEIAHPTSRTGRLTVSIGAASILPSPHSNQEELVRRADSALYQAKSAGRNQTCQG